MKLMATFSVARIFTNSSILLVWLVRPNRSPFNTQDKEIQQKREEAMKRFMAAKKRKQQRIAELEKMLRQDFRTRTGQEPTSVNVW